jgi:hypothetical protein
MRVHPSWPIADGIPFDDLGDLDDALVNLLASRNVVYLTEFEDGGRRHGGRIVAASWQDAERVAFGRALGEKVIGILCEVGEAPLSGSADTTAGRD